MMRFLLLNFFLFIFFSLAWGQNEPNCTQTLRLANYQYEQGRLHEIEGILEKCLKGGFTKQEKVQAYKILCLTYIYLENPEKADEAMLNLLRTDPYFEINPEVDPAELVALYGSFRTHPIYRVGALLGVNSSRPNVSSSLAVLTGTSSYSPIIDFQFGGTLELPLNRKETWTLNPGLQYQRKAFAYNSEVNFGTNPQSAEGKENQIWLSLPVLIQYKFADKKYKPYVGIGITTDYLMASTLTIARFRQSAAQVTEQRFKISPMREHLNISAALAAGLKLPLGGGYFVAEARYLHGLLPINSDETAYQNIFLSMDYGYADNPYTLASLSLSAGYIFNIFKPKKLTRKTK